jgi:hypothetical protein
VIEHYFNEGLTVIATRADVGITEPPCFLRVVDRFTVNAAGQITQQENHYDPGPQSIPLRRGFAVRISSKACCLGLCPRCRGPKAGRRKRGAGAQRRAYTTPNTPRRSAEEKGWSQTLTCERPYSRVGR